MKQRFVSSGHTDLIISGLNRFSVKIDGYVLANGALGVQPKYDVPFIVGAFAENRRSSQSVVADELMSQTGVVIEFLVGRAYLSLLGQPFIDHIELGFR